jgi:serine/threonine protein kinase
MSSNVFITRTIEELYSLLVDVSTGRPFEKEDSRYQKLRRRLAALVPLIGPLPPFIETSKNLWEYWNENVKGILPSFQSRRDFLAKEFKEFYDKQLAKMRKKSFEEEMTLRDLAIEDTIGEGGFSVVYRAEHIVLGEPRAIKKLDPIFADEDGEIKALRRFAREAKILIGINHRNIVRVYDCGIAGENPFIIMDFIEGKDLERWINDEGVFDEHAGLAIIKQVLEAISATHSQGIVHRDIKPKNIMWNGSVATILDFGAGSWLERQIISSRITTSPIGTYGYIANELYDDPTLLHKNIDCYSIGVLLHFILTGHSPSTGDPKYYLSANRIQENISDFILKALSPPDKRFEDGNSMLGCLLDINQEAL